MEKERIKKLLKAARMEIHVEPFGVISTNKKCPHNRELCDSRCALFGIDYSESVPNGAIKVIFGCTDVAEAIGWFTDNIETEMKGFEDEN